MEKKYIYFTECYKHYTGKLWDWENDGNPEESDAYTRGLYHGFTMAKKGQDELRLQLNKPEYGCEKCNYRGYTVKSAENKVYLDSIEAMKAEREGKTRTTIIKCECVK